MSKKETDREVLDIEVEEWTPERLEKAKERLAAILQRLRAVREAKAGETSKKENLLDC